MELLALGKPIKKPPRSDERDGELFCGTTEVAYVNKYRLTRNSQQTAQLDASKNYMLFVYLAYTDTSSSSRAEAYTIINNEMSKIMTGTGTYGVVSYNTSTHILTMKGTDSDGTITWFILFELK